MLELDEFKDKNFSGMEMDNDYNVYLLGRDNQSNTATPLDSIYIIKLDGVKLWNLPLFDSEFDEGAFSVFPNPTTSSLSVSYVGPKLNGPVHLKVFDVLGQEIIAEEMQISTRETIVTPNFSNVLTQGTYFLKLYDEIGRTLVMKQFVFVE